MNRQQLDRRDAEVLQIAEGGLGREPGVGAAEILADLRMGLGESLDMGLVDDRVGERDLQPAVSFPVERVVDHDRFRNRGRVVLVVGLEVVVLERRWARTGTRSRPWCQSTIPSIAFA